MKHIYLLLTSLLIGCSSSPQIESFELHYQDVFETYDYYRQEYKKQLCSDSGKYTEKLELSTIQIERIIHEADKINFFQLPNSIEHRKKVAPDSSEDIERIEICAPCPTKTLYLKIGDDSHTVSWSCNCSNFNEPTPKPLKALVESVEDSIQASPAYKKAPESFCGLR